MDTCDDSVYMFTYDNFVFTEHRNMPLEDALRLVSQNFEQYMQDLRKRAGELDKDKDSEREKVKEREKEKERPVEREKEHEREKRSSFGSSAASKPVSQDSDDMKKLLAKAAGGEQLSTNELSKLIENLSKQKKQSDTPASQSSAGGNTTTCVLSLPKEIQLHYIYKCFEKLWTKMTVIRTTSMFEKSYNLFVFICYIFTLRLDGLN